MTEIEIVKYAASNMAVLAPMLTAGVSFAATEMSKGALAKLGADGLEWLKSSLGLIQPALQADSVAAPMLEACSRNPEDLNARDTLENALIRLVENDDALMAKIIAQAPQSLKAEGGQSFQISGSGNQINFGKNANVAGRDIVNH